MAERNKNLPPLNLHQFTLFVGVEVATLFVGMGGVGRGV